MKKIFSAVCILSLSLSVIWSSPLGKKEEESLTFQKLKEGEVVSSIQSSPHSKTHRCKVMGLIYAPIETVWDIICDYNSYDKLIPRTPVAFLVNPQILNLWQEQTIKNWNQFEEQLIEHRIETYGDNPFYFYNRFKMPWPLKDRHFVLKTERFPEIYKSQWVEIIGNTQINEGSWELMPLENDRGTTLAVYTLNVDPGIALPKNIIQKGMEGISAVIHSLRQRAYSHLQNK